MRVFVQSLLPCDAERAWATVQTSALLLEVSRPLVALYPPPGETLPQRWAASTTVRFRPYLFGFIPLATREMTLESIDDRQRQIQTRERDALIRRWDHVIKVEPVGTGACRYSDEIEINAGLLTPVVWLFACWFYRHRQRQWQIVARRLQSGEIHPRGG